MHAHAGYSHGVRRPAAVLVLLLSTLPVVWAATGGPDTGGIEYLTSEETYGPPHVALDIDDEGIELGLGDEDTGLYELPFEVSWYGSTEDQLYIGDNGTAFWSGDQAYASASCPPSGSWSGIAAYWDELAVDSVRVAELGQYPYRMVVVDWQGIQPGSAAGSGQVQVWFQEGRKEVVIVHEDVDFGDASYDGGVGAVVGVQGSSSSGLDWSCTGGLSDGVSAWFGKPAWRAGAEEAELYLADSYWYGADDYMYLGASLGGGDVNADGYDDVFVGSTEDDRVFLFYGGASPGLGDTDSAAATISGSSADEFGSAIAVADLDGDGLLDLAVGEPRNDDAATDAGAVHLFANAAWSGDLSASSDADATLLGSSSSTKSKAGTVIAAAGDIDGDGYEELLVGAPGDDTAYSNAGMAYISWGGPLSGTSSLSEGFSGESPYDELGEALSGGDADGDGLADVVLGVRASDAAYTGGGRGYLVLGGSWSGTNDVASNAEATFDGEGSSDALGTSVLVADLDGDGYGELLFGVPKEDFGATDAGAVCLFEDGSAWSGSYTASDADVVISGDTSYQRFGAALDAGDIDADGVDDLIVGGDGGTASAGGAFIFRGIPTSGSATMSDADHSLSGSYSGGGAGTAVLLLDDHDGDGLGEAVVAAKDSSVGDGTLNGIVHIWSYAPSWLDEDNDGIVGRAAEGPDCDDGDSNSFPSNDEDTGLDTGGYADDNDCDGWVDGAYTVRLDEDLWQWDTTQTLGTTTVETFDFEDASKGDDLSSHYSGNGLELTASGAVTAQDDIHGADPKDSLAAKVFPGSADNAILLTFDEDVDALAFQLLDAEGTIRLNAYLSDTSDLLDSGGDLRVDHDGADLAGGRFVGVTFGESVTYVRVEAELSDGFGLDDIQVVWATQSDRDGDGYTGADGDCDDSDADVNPGATEDITNGKDDDCDGVVDAGSASTETDYSTWESAAGITVEQIDFEDLTVGDTVADDYSDLGVTFDDDLEVVTDIDGAGVNDAQAAEAVSRVVTLTFEETQPAVGFWIFDANGSFTFEGNIGSTTAYSDTISLSLEGTDSFRGFLYDYGIEELVITGPPSDDWGLDDVVFSELGLDDGDGDGYTEADGDCDDSDASANPGATETWYDGTDNDCDGGSDYDADGDGYDIGADCDDSESETNPDAEETWYDGTDSDCDGGSDYDADGDGYDSELYGGEDCDDSEAETSPDVEETWYDGVDSNCDGADDYDADADGYSTEESGGSGSGGSTDCDDGDADTYPGAEETWYDGVDSDCDGESDSDADGDGYDAEAEGGEDCNDSDSGVNPDAEDTWYDGVDSDCDDASDYDADTDGFDSDDYGGDDCDDSDASINPDATESDDDDGIDEDCDGVDEWDDDLDGYRGVENGGTDCDDEDDSVNPGEEEICYDGTDQDCDGTDDEYDCDADGYDSDSYSGDDCDDDDASIHPGATEYVYDDVDQDCDGADDFDADGDGYQVDFYGGDDCDDDDARVNPGATDVWYDGVDSDCAGDSDYDADIDGFDSSDYGGADCDDDDASICPSCTEAPYDGIDQDCDGADARDVDGDGYADEAEGGDDCDDSDPSVSPAADETWYDGFDEDCADDSDYDADHDGQDWEAYGGADCDDEDPEVYFDAPEVWYDGIDQDCLGGDDYDQDNDGFSSSTWSGDDCDDLDSEVNPGVTEDLCDDIDADCDGELDEDEICEDTGDTGDSSPPEDTEAPEDSSVEEDTGRSYVGFPESYVGWTTDEGCGCTGTRGRLGAWAIVALLLAVRRRRGLGESVSQ